MTVTIEDFQLENYILEEELGRGDLTIVYRARRKSDDAVVALGVGKNMVDSIRHWCEVAQLVEPDPNPKKHSARRLLGRELLGDHGGILTARAWFR